MTEICKHCGLEIEGSGPAGWVHLEGPQTGKHRCALEPYGYDAAPASEACSFACRGYVRDEDYENWLDQKPLSGK